MTLGPGTQVLYVPEESEGDDTHESCREGFVTSRHSNGQYNVRFWRPGTKNDLDEGAVATQVKACYLLEKKSRPQPRVSEWLMKLYGVEIPFKSSAERHKKTVADTAVLELTTSRSAKEEEDWQDTEI